MIGNTVVRPRDARFTLPRVRAIPAAWLLGLVASLTIVGWLPIVRWYSLPANQAHTHFAFEKVPGGFSSPQIRATLMLLLLLALLYAAGYRLLRAQPAMTPGARIAIVLFFVAPAVANLFLYPVGALDAFNYLVELKLTYGYGQNPYLETFAAYRDDPYALPAFLVNVPLFYGPVWLLVYGLPVLAVGFASITTLLGAVKVLNVALLALTGIVIFRAHQDARRGWLAVYLLLANPLVIFEGIGNAHNDVLMTLFLVAAMVALRRKAASTGPLLALSTLVKPFTLALAPLFLVAMLRERWGWRRLLLTAGMSAVVIVVTVAPFWADGAMLSGLRRGTLRSQQMDHVSLLSLAQQATRSWPSSAWIAPFISVGNGCVPGSQGGIFTTSGSSMSCHPRWLSLSARKDRVTYAAAALFAVLALLIAIAVARGRPPEAAAVDTLLLFFLLVTKLYSWYLIPIFALLALQHDRLGRRYFFAATALGLAYYPAYVFARVDHEWPELTIHLFLSLFLTVPILVFLGAELWRSASRRWRWRTIPALPSALRRMREEAWLTGD